MTNINKHWCLNLKFFKRFKRDEDGVAAIEFALVAVPFMALLFGIIELAVVFFVSSSLQAATVDAGRLIRTGQYNHPDESEFESQICTHMNPSSTSKAADCESRLTVKISLLSDFSAHTSFGSGTVSNDVDTNGDALNFTASSGGETVIIMAIYEHPLSMPGRYTKLKNVTGSENIREIATVTAFRNEPF